MDVREQILAAAHRLAARKPLDRLTITDVARAAGVSWPTVRRHVGSRTQLRTLLAQELASPGHPDTRSRILAAAGRTFAKHGYDGATLDQMAAEAGMTKGAVYWHFASKSDLFLALLEDRARSQLAAAPELAQTFARSSDPEQGLKAVLASLFASCLDDPDWPRLSLEFTVHTREPEVRDRLGAFYLTSYETVGRLIQQMQVDGLLARDLNPVALSILLSAVLNGLVFAWLVDPERLDPRPWLPHLARILWRGTRPSGHDQAHGGAAARAKRRRQDRARR